MTTAQLIALLSSPLAPVLAGIVGSILEKIGMAYSLPRLIAFGKMLESVAADLPKLIFNVKALAKGEPKDPPPSDPDVTVRIIPEPPPVVAPDFTRLHNDKPEPPTAAIVGLALLVTGCASVPITNKRCSFDNLEYSAHVAMCRKEIEETCLLNENSTPLADCPALVKCEAWRKEQCQ
jgi:hypothetical protein